MPNLNAWAPTVLSALRIMAALLYLHHGTQKMFGFPEAEMVVGLSFTTLPGISAILEVVLGVLIALGAFTRPAAFIASGHMAAAYFIAHAPQDPFPSRNGGDASILFCFVFLYLVFAGPGRWSVDHMRGRVER